MKASAPDMATAGMVIQDESFKVLIEKIILLPYMAPEEILCIY